SVFGVISCIASRLRFAPRGRSPSLRKPTGADFDGLGSIDRTQGRLFQCLPEVTRLDGRSSIMDQRFPQRKDRLRADGLVPPGTFRGGLRRLETFAHPFIVPLPSPQSQEHARTDLFGLLADIDGVPKDVAAPLPLIARR